MATIMGAYHVYMKTPDELTPATVSDGNCKWPFHSLSKHTGTQRPAHPRDTVRSSGDTANSTLPLPSHSLLPTKT